MVRINPSELMTTPLPVRWEPKTLAVNASSGTSARSFNTDRLMASKSSPGIAAPRSDRRCAPKGMPKLRQVPLLKRHDPTLMLGVTARLIMLRQDPRLVVLRDLLVLLRGLIPAPDHSLDVGLRRIAVDQPIKVHIGTHGAT